MSNYVLPIVLMLILTCACEIAVGQVRFDARSTGMGGTSITHSSDATAAFINPANLMLGHENSSWNITLGNAGIYYSNGYRRSITNSLNAYVQPFLPFSPDSDYQTEIDLTRLINNWYGEQGQTSEFKNSIDVHSFGLSYQSPDFALAINHRLRGDSQTGIGRGWYDIAFRNVDGIYMLDRSLKQTTTMWHEVAIGVAWEQKLISGLLGNRNIVSVGINPKILLPIYHSKQNLESKYAWVEQNSEQIQHLTSYSGFISDKNTEYLKSVFNNSYLNPPNPGLKDFNGIGLGFDAGVSWRIMLSDQIRYNKHFTPWSDYHLTFSLAFQDIGFMGLASGFRKLEIAEEVESQSFVGFSPKPEYSGSPDQFAEFMSTEINNFQQRLSENTDSETLALSSTVLAGVGLQLNQIHLALEYQQHSNTSGKPEQHSIHVGNEIRFLSLLSVRSGVIFQSSEAITYTAGIGIDTNLFSLSAGTYARQASAGEVFRPVLLNVGSVSVRF